MSNKTLGETAYSWRGLVQLEALLQSGAPAGAPRLTIRSHFSSMTRRDDQRHRRPLPAIWGGCRIACSSSSGGRYAALAFFVSLRDACHFPSFDLGTTAEALRQLSNPGSNLQRPTAKVHPGRLGGPSQQPYQRRCSVRRKGHVQRQSRTWHCQPAETYWQFRARFFAYLCVPAHSLVENSLDLTAPGLAMAVAFRACFFCIRLAQENRIDAPVREFR